MNEIIMISEKLSPLVQEKELEISDNIKDLPPIISILENGFIELKELVSGGYATIFRTN